MTKLLTNGFLHFAGALQSLGNWLLSFKLISSLVYNRIIIVVCLYSFNSLFVELLPDGSGNHWAAFDFLPETTAYHYSYISNSILMLFVYVALLYGSSKTNNMASVVVGFGFLPTLFYEIYYQFHYQELYSKWYLVKPLAYNACFIVILIVIWAIVLDQILQRKNQ